MSARTIRTAALPPDVRKVSDFPLNSHLIGAAPPGLLGSAPIHQNCHYERHSLPLEFLFYILSPFSKGTVKKIRRSR